MLFIVLLASKSNVMRYGDVYIGESRTLSFTMSNHSESTVRFVWPNDSHVQFSPRVGHLRAGCSKDMTATLKVDKPLTLSEHEVKCRVVRIAYDRSASDVADWDDRLKTVKWITAAPHSASADT